MRNISHLRKEPLYAAPVQLSVPALTPRPGRPDLFPHRGRGFSRLSRLFGLSALLFLLTLRRAATSAFLAECVLLAPLLLLFYLLEPGSSPMPQALGLSFALSLIFFCLFHTWLEWKESRDCA